MSDGFFSTIVTTPLYNGMVLLMGALPWADLGVVIILFTCIIRLVLFPLAQKSVKTQIVMQEIQPKLDAIREQFKGDPQQQASRTMAVYKENGLNPFASILFMFIQIPIIFGLYFMFLHAGFPSIDSNFLYSFVHVPAGVDTMFLGFVDMTVKSIPIAILAGVFQFIQAQLMKMPKPKQDDKPSFGKEFTKSLNFQMKYVFPLIIIFVAAALPASIALYWATSNVFSIGQELYVRKHLKKQGDNVVTV
ncbi:MAG: YidC/Oxa1 family rane protein insertase [Patescibacteria group bacterium]|jgi:YidC/Oxa1 family membrane protein insertase|nr:YidC/Oxa1 family rane protein insertase [Patescibacteria group bacterium]